VFFPGGDYQQVFIAFVVALVTAGGLPMFSTVWWIYALYAAGVMIPFNGVLFAYGTDFFHLLGAAVPLLYIANVATAYQLGKAFSSAYGLRSAYERLSADNADTQAQLGEQLDSLLEAHREVQAFGRKLALFSEQAPIAVFEVDPQATILDMNPAAENLFGYAAPEMVGRNCISMLLNPDDRESTDKWWAELVAQGRPATVVAERCLRRDGLELACEWTMTPLVDDDNRVISVILQGRDITQQRAAERMRSEFTSTLEPRAAHAAHFDHRLAAAAARRGARRGLQGAGRNGRDRREEQPAPARPDQRGAGHREDRVGAADAGARAHAARCAAGRVAAAQPGLRRRFRANLALHGEVPRSWCGRTESA